MNNHISTPNRSGGFGLIEVLIVIAILGVLAYFAIPAYQNYQTRSRVVEALEFADAAREPVEEALAEGQKPPADLLGSGGGRVDLLTGLPWTATADGGYMLAEMDLPKFGNVAAFALELQEQGGTHAWHCRNASKYTKGVALGDAYLPSSCRGSGSQHAVANLQLPPAAPPAAPSVKADPPPPPPPSPPPSVPVVTNATTVVHAIPTKDDHPCKDGFAFTPHPGQNNFPMTGSCQPDSKNRSDPYKSVQCQVCSGPVQICEKLHHEKTCEWPNNICSNHVINQDSGARTVDRSCTNRQTAMMEWYYGTSDNDRCTTFEQGNIYTLGFECTYACTGDNCNVRLSPLGDGRTKATMYDPPSSN